MDFQTTDNPHTINKPSNPPGVMVPECVASPSESENNSPSILDDNAQSPVGSDNLVMRRLERLRAPPEHFVPG